MIPVDKLDALAMIRAAIDADDEATAVILEHADPRAVAAAMAEITAFILVDVLGGQAPAAECLADIQQSLAEGEASP